MMVQAQQALNYFDYNGAVKYMTRAVKLEPDNQEILLQRANLYLLMERNKQAKKDFDALIQIDSTNALIWIGLAEYFRNTEQLDTALKCAEWSQILAMDDITLARARISLADVHLAQDSDSLAAVYYMTSLEVDSTNVAALKKVAFLLSKQARYDEANSYLMRAYNLDRYDIETLTNIAYTYNQVEFYRDALEYANLALELDPQHPIILSNRAYAYFNMEMEKEALDDIKRSLNNDGSNPMAHRYAGEIYLSLKDADKACKSFRKAEKYGYTTAFDDFVSVNIEQHCNGK